MQNPFVTALTQFSLLSEVSQQDLAAVSRRLVLEKGHVLVQAGKVSDYIYFIEQGLSRTYYLKEGREVTDWLSADGEIAGSIVSFLSRQPDGRIIHLLEPSVVWAVSYQSLEMLYARHHDMERLGRLLVSHGLLQLQHRFDALHMATALERYQGLLANKPSLLQRVPLGMLASYLGMTPETLSRIRAQV
ncbi:Crp/Fnr family transcriptional regulator [Fibrella sp. HMF5335]|uniref:Crp/Fnr family transcriptional regulator n=1 Tax=Fibrella rubiginis TaxID=2817060 RepID=A0A939GI95_9BACT|nr:Crp/Fnr family transcriptional regulator [Fibrella rubiginis]MBO0938791.1 Crp/Fnr family transcriptional regulator [Fibrella rubiginis]